MRASVLRGSLPSADHQLSLRFEFGTLNKQCADAPSVSFKFMSYIMLIMWDAPVTLPVESPYLHLLYVLRQVTVCSRLYLL